MAHPELITELETSVSAGGVNFCGVNVQEFAIGGVTYGWKKGSRLKIALDFEDLGPLRATEVREVVEAGVNEVREVTDGLTFDLFGSTIGASLICRLARIDGPQGVLADCTIPPPGSTPDTFQGLMRIDAAEMWRKFKQQQIQNAIDFGRVWLHEFLHFLGLGHQPASIREPALIMAMYSPLVDGLMPPDKREIVRRYDGKVAPPPGTSPRTVNGEINIVIDGVTWTAAGPLKRKV